MPKYFIEKFSHVAGIIAIVILAAAFLSCGSSGDGDGDASDSGGELSFTLEWEAPPADGLSAEAGSDVCTDYGIDDIYGYVLDSGSTTISTGAWTCSSHGGELYGVPEGTGYTVRIEGVVDGAVVWVGETTGVTVSAGSVSDAGAITMVYIGDDATPPTIINTSPADLDTYVLVTGSVTATFSEHMASTTLNTSTVLLYNEGTPVAGTVRYNSILNSVTFDPASPLAYLSSYSAYIEGAEDMAGNVIFPHLWSFTTAPEGYTSPVTEDASDVADTTATLNGSFTNPTGFTTTAWFEYGLDTTYGLTTASQSYATSGAVAAPAAIGSLDDQSAYHFRLVTQNTDGTFYGEDMSFTTLGTPTTLASGQSYPLDIAVDSTSVYWTESSGGTVKKVGINGGTVTTLASGLSSSYGIAIDSTSVYFTDSDAVKKVGIDGGTVTTLASGLSSPYGIAVDSTSVYWTEYDGDTVKKVGIDGGTVTTLASGLSGSYSIAVDSTSVYWTENNTSSTVKKVGIDGGAVTTIASGYYSNNNIALDSTSVYWDYGDIYKVGKDGGPVIPLGVYLTQMVGDIAIDSTSVYYSYSDGPTISKVDINGGAVTELAYININMVPPDIAIDSTSVYFADYDSSSSTYSIKKVSK